MAPLPKNKCVNRSPAYLGYGIIIGSSVNFGMLLGAIVGWGILSPMAKHNGWAVSPINDWDTLWFTWMDTLGWHRTNLWGFCRWPRLGDPQASNVLGAAPGKSGIGRTGKVATGQPIRLL